MTRLIVPLPEQPERAATATDWLLLRDGVVVDSGEDERWLDIARADGGGIALIGLAPATIVRLHFGVRPDEAASDRQVLAIARMAAVDASLGDRETLHAVAAIPDEGQATLTAVVANDVMLGWLTWAERLGIALDHVVPEGLMLPLGKDWTAIDIAGQRIVGREGMVIPAEESLVDALTAGEPVHWLDEAAATDALVRLASAPPIDLRSGRFAKRARLFLDRARVRELAILAAIVPLLALLHVLVLLLQLNQSTRALDREALAVAQSVAGNGVTLETAESALAARAGADGGFTPTLSALLGKVQAQPNLSSTQLAYTADGTLAVTLAAPRAQDINRALLALQRDGFKITAVPRQAADGRSMADVTIRSAS